MGSHSLFQGGLAGPGIELGSPALQADSLSSEPPGKSHLHWEIMTKASHWETQGKSLGNGDSAPHSLASGETVYPWKQGLLSSGDACAEYVCLENPGFQDLQAHLPVE